MNDNRYSPPKARVDDVPGAEALEARPVEVTNAIKLWVASYCMGLVVLVWDWEYYSKLYPGSSPLYNQIVSVSVSVWIGYKIYRGRNWARIVWLVMGVFTGLMGLSGTVRNMVAAMPTASKLQMFVALGVNVIILWLLFFSPGRSWFARRNG